MRTNVKTSSVKTILENDKINIVLGNKYKKISKVSIVNDLLEKMYEKLAKTQLEYIFDEYRFEMGVAPEDYSYGFSNPDGVSLEDNIVTINPELFRNSEEVVRYVILHQFCHLTFKNHTKSYIVLI